MHTPHTKRIQVLSIADTPFPLQLQTLGFIASEGGRGEGKRQCLSFLGTEPDSSSTAGLNSPTRTPHHWSRAGSWKNPQAKQVSQFDSHSCRSVLILQGLHACRQLERKPQAKQVFQFNIVVAAGWFYEEILQWGIVLELHTSTHPLSFLS